MIRWKLVAVHQLYDHPCPISRSKVNGDHHEIMIKCTSRVSSNNAAHNKYNSDQAKEEPDLIKDIHD
jgi:hypothetical protein